MHKIGIIGTGWGTRVQVPAFRAAGLEVVALSGTNAEKTRRIADDLNVLYASGDWQTMIYHGAVQMVSVVTPPVFHCEMSLAVLEAGKHVICEKPTAFDASEAQKMAQAAAERPNQLSLIDHELRFMPAMQAARRMVAEGAIGTLRHAESWFVNSSRANLKRPWNWWSDETQGGGVLGAIGSHQIDVFRHVLNDEVIAAQGHLATFVKERPLVSAEENDPPEMRTVTVDDFATFQLQFARGGVANVTTSMVARMNDMQRWTFYGDEGTLQFINGKLLYARPDEPFADVTPQTEFEIDPAIQQIYADYAEASVFLGHAIRKALDGDKSGLAEAATFEDGLRVQQVIDAIRQSSRNAQGWVTI